MKYTTCTATISADGNYRYKLVRSWAGPAEATRAVTFVMFNPSTADGTYDDQTIRKCVKFTATWGYNTLKVVNLFALRSSDPLAIAEFADPVGEMNDHYLWSVINCAQETNQPLVAAWGALGSRTALGLERVRKVAQIVTGAPWQCLGICASGQPKHPLYLRGNTMLEPWTVPA